MKRAAVTPTLALCLALLGCASEKKNAMEGTWRVVAGTMKTADTTISGMMPGCGCQWNRL